MIAPFSILLATVFSLSLSLWLYSAKGKLMPKKLRRSL